MPKKPKEIKPVEIVPVEEKESRKSSPKFIPIETLIKYSEKGLTLEEIGKQVGVSKQAVHGRFKKEGYTPDRLRDYRKYKKDIMNLKQSQILNALTPKKIKEMGGRDLTVSLGILEDKIEGKKVIIEHTVNMDRELQTLKELEEEELELTKRLENAGIVDAEVIDSEIIEEG